MFQENPHTDVCRSIGAAGLGDSIVSGLLCEPPSWFSVGTGTEKEGWRERGREREEKRDRLYRTFIIPAFQFLVDVNSHIFL